MKKLAFLSIVGLSLVSAASAASIMCQTAGWSVANKIVEREAFGLNNAMPTKGFMTLETQAGWGGVGEHLNIVFDNEKAFICSSPEDNRDNQACEVFSSIDEIKNRYGINNKILTFKAFYSTPRGLLSVSAPAPGTDRFADLRENGVEVCFIR